MKAYIIKKSKIHGFGLFANKNFRRGELIFGIDLSKLPKLKHGIKLSKEDELHVDYAGRGQYVVGVHPYVYINHSCDPNVLVKHETIARSKFYAMRDVHKGAQLTYDYGVNAMDQIDKELWRTKCKCGTKNCRGILSTCFLKQPLGVQGRYYGCLPPSLRRKYKKALSRLRDCAIVKSCIMPKYFLVADVGTTGVKALVFSADLKVVGRAYARLKKAHPHQGWVEQSPQEIVELTKKVLREAVRASRVPLNSLQALGITNQRETTIVWDCKTGKPVYPAIVWEDKRTANECTRTKREKLEPMVREKTGLTIDPYFSATKIGWILQRLGLRGSGGRASRYHDLRFGTVDTWILWNLLEGRPHLTDWTNASRTLLYNIRTLAWDEDLLRIFRVPRAILPKVRPSRSQFGILRKEIIGVRLPVCAVCGDQQASMYGVGVRPGATKVTYGTGTFLVQSLGSHYVLKHPFFTTLMPGLPAQAGTQRPQFALEAKIEGSGVAIDQVLHDPRKLDNALTRIARKVDVYIKKLPFRPHTLVIDGGITRDGKMVSIQAQVSDVSVRRQVTDDGTALGVAKLLRDN